MSSFWDRIYQTDNSFFGEAPSNFALSCYNEYMKKKNHLKKILELGCGQGRDTLFFTSKGIDVTALDLVLNLEKRVTNLKNGVGLRQYPTWSTIYLFTGKPFITETHQSWSDCEKN
jgi:hypothetical protein